MEASFASSSLQYAISIINSCLKVTEQKSLLNPVVLVVSDSHSYISFQTEQFHLQLPLTATFNSIGELALNLAELKKYLNTDRITIKSDDSSVTFEVNSSTITLPLLPIPESTFDSIDGWDSEEVFPNLVVSSLFKSASNLLPLQPANYNAVYIRNGFVTLTDNLIVYIQDAGEQYNNKNFRVPYQVVVIMLQIQKIYNCALKLSISKMDDFVYYKITPDRLHTPLNFIYREATNLTEHNHIDKVEKLYPMLLENTGVAISNKVFKQYVESALKVIGKSIKRYVNLAFSFDKLIIEAVSGDASSKFTATIPTELSEEVGSFNIMLNVDLLNKSLAVLPDDQILLSTALEKKILMLSSSDHRQTICIARA